MKKLNVILVAVLMAFNCMIAKAQAPVANDNITAHCEDEVEVTAVANDGYRFDHWSDGVLTATRTIIVSKDTDLVAYFVPDLYTVSVAIQSVGGSVVDWGSVELSGDNTEGQYEYGTTVTITATPSSSCYEFAYWADDESNTNPVRQITIGTENEYIAVFKQASFNVRISSDNATFGGVLISRL